MPATSFHRFLSRRMAVVVALAMPALGAGCVVNRTTTSQQTTEESVTGEGGVGGVAGAGQVVSRTTTSVTQFNLNGKNKVSIVVDGHPEITRTFQGNVDVKTDKTVQDGVTRTTITVKKKEGGEVLEVITL
jgi:hypothetical protein